MLFVYFTNEEKEKAHQTDIVSLLKAQGETVKRSGNEFEWKDGSQKVTSRGNRWFPQYERVGGDAIDFVRRFYNKSYAEAMEYLLSGSGGMLTVSPPIIKEEMPFAPPPKNDNMHRVYAYLLNRRGIDKDVLNDFAYKQMVYESEKYHNVVFVGYDKNGVPRHASMRGTGLKSTYKGNVANSQPEYSFHWHGRSKYIFLFEAPIDLLSFISMHKTNWKNHSYAASCSVSDRVLFQCLKDNSNIEKVYICFDNDEPGQAAAHRIDKNLSNMGMQSEILVPIHKDWNEDLLFSNEQSEKEGEEPCQTLLL